ncbi:MAG: rhodanese-like domain-containing protein [Fusobacteriota bacterium]
MKKILILIILINFFGCNSQKSGATKVQKVHETVPVAEIDDIKKENTDVVILDVRTPGEYQSGHLEDAINIDYYANDFSKKLDELNKNKTYIIYCRSGNRTGKTLDMMEEMGFKKVYDIKGGIISIQRANYPLVK